MLRQVLTELLLRDGVINLLLGSRGSGEEGELGRFITDSKARQQFLLDSALQCQEAGLYDKSIEIQNRIGALSMALDTINKCLSEAICALSRGRLDGESRTARLIHAGNEILENYKYYPEVSFKELAGSRPLIELRTAEASAVVVEGAASEAGAQTTEEDAHPDSGEKSPRTVSAGITEAEELKKYSNKVT